MYKRQLISHRINTLMDCDKIMVLDEGRIAEMGSHEELMAIDGGVYRRIYDLQSAASSETSETEDRQ